MAVTEHITGSLGFESRTHVRGTRKGHADPAWLLGGPLGWIMALTGDRLVASRTVSERPRQYAVLGGVERPCRVVRFARLMIGLSAFSADLWSAPPAAAVSADVVASQGGVA
jgi:hypothetical protein